MIFGCNIIINFFKTYRDFDCIDCMVTAPLVILTIVVDIIKHSQISMMSYEIMNPTTQWDIGLVFLYKLHAENNSIPPLMQE